MFKPILFNTEMVQAIQAGRKTQTRRIIKPQPVWDGISCFHISKYGCWAEGRNDRIFSAEDNWPINTGDILWVRETWCDPEPDNFMVPIFYKADMPLHWDAEDTAHGEAVDITAEDFKWRPSIHMPKDFARIFLRVKEVRVERLMDISESDCMAEGIRSFTKDGKLLKYATQSGDMPSIPWQDMPENPKDAFWDLWNSTIKPSERDEYGFLANPWVWVIEFERIEKPRDWK